MRLFHFNVCKLQYLNKKGSCKVHKCDTQLWVEYHFYFCFLMTLSFTRALPSSCVFQGKLESAATSVQLRCQIQVSVRLSVCHTPPGGSLASASADKSCLAMTLLWETQAECLAGALTARSDSVLQLRG